MRCEICIHIMVMFAGQFDAFIQRNYITLKEYILISSCMFTCFFVLPDFCSCWFVCFHGVNWWTVFNPIRVIV